MTHRPKPHHHHHTGTRAPREPLPSGAGVGSWLFLDCPSGVAGDMLVAALLDLGVPQQVVHDAVAELPLEGFRLEVGAAEDHAVWATTFTVQVEPGAQQERSYAAIDEMLQQADLQPAVQRLARASFRRLAEAEAEVHGTEPAQVVFHEVGAVDSIVDIVAAAAALSHLGASIAASPLPMGRGFVSSRHGMLPLPAPATVLCLRGVPTYGVALDAELVTPTGAALVATAAERYVRWPSLVPERVGYGAGQQRFPSQPNLVRAVLGAPSAVAEATPEPDTHLLLEANVDDMTGELAGHALGALLAAGAADAWASPIVMKKGRPALRISALAPAACAEQVAEALLRETTSIGLRRWPVHRIERPREMVTVQTRFGPIPLKISAGAIEPPQIKPEFDACAAAAQEHGVPVRQVLAEALAAHGHLDDRK